MKPFMITVLVGLTITLGGQELSMEHRELLGRALGQPEAERRLADLETALAVMGIEPIAVENAGDTGDWQMEVKAAPLTDEKRFVFLLEGETGGGRYSDRVFLIIRQQEGALDLYINWNDYLGSEARVTHRVGKDDAVTGLWNLSTDKQACFYPGNIPELITGLLENDSLVARVVPYNENPVTAVFDIRGLRAAAEPHAAELGWW
jgi:hypothetical protein